jgi:hypothetical protein
MHVRSSSRCRELDTFPPVGAVQVVMQVRRATAAAAASLAFQTVWWLLATDMAGTVARPIHGLTQRWAISNHVHVLDRSSFT